MTRNPTKTEQSPHASPMPPKGFDKHLLATRQSLGMAQEKPPEFIPEQFSVYIDRSLNDVEAYAQAGRIYAALHRFLIVMEQGGDFVYDREAGLRLGFVRGYESYTLRYGVDTLANQVERVGQNLWGVNLEKLDDLAVDVWRRLGVANYRNWLVACSDKRQALSGRSVAECAYLGLALVKHARRYRDGGL